MNFNFIQNKVMGVLLILATSLSSSAEPEVLTDFDKRKMAEQLDKLRNVAENTSRNRFASALIAFRSAVKSEAAAHALYLKCIEKVDFEDKKKSSQEFREWKRRHKERTDTLGFRKALQHQLNWLLITVEASADPDKIAALGVTALEKVDVIMKDHKILKDHQRTLKADVLSSVYARAYNINGLKAKDWPKSALDFGAIYDKVVMPPLRNADSIPLLRSAWRKRIEHEGLVQKNWGALPKTDRIGLKKDLVPPAYLKWLDEKYPELLWKREVECYEAGDEKQAVEAMLGLLNKYIDHKKSLKWVEELQSVLVVTEEIVEEPVIEPAEEQ